jgi:hypothetical protein
MPEVNVNTDLAAEWDFLFGAGIWMVLLTVLYFAYYTTIFGPAFRTNPAMIYLIALSFIFASSGISIPQMFSLINPKTLLKELLVGGAIGLVIMFFIVYGTNISLSVISPFSALTLSSTPSSIQPYENISIVAPVILIAVMEEAIVFVSAFFFTSGLIKKFKMGLKDAFLVALVIASIFFGLTHVIAYQQEGLLSMSAILFAMFFSLIAIRLIPLELFRSKTYPIFSAMGIHAAFDFAVLALLPLTIIPIHP